MATSDFGVNHPVAVKAWSTRLFREALKNTVASKFIGKDSNSVMCLKSDLQKGPGDRIRVPLRMQLTGNGIEGDGTLEGNEEALTIYTDDLVLNQLRHAVRSEGKMSEQRIPFSVREEARQGLQDWWTDRIDQAFFNQLAGVESADSRLRGHNATVDAFSSSDTAHIVFPDSDTTEADVASSGASSIMTLTLIDACVEKAQTLTPMIRPTMVGGEKKYVMFLHPYQVYDLRTNTNTGQWLDIQKAAMQGGQISKNPIYTGALGEYNNVIIHQDERVPEVTANVRRAVFAGAQAGIMGYGQMSANGRMNWVEELFDFKNQLGVSAGMIWGMKKTRFNSLDFGTIVVPTYAIAHG